MQVTHKDTKIAYQNKDIVCKLFGDGMKGKPLSLFGWQTNEKVVDIHPTNLPLVEALELRIDNLFELEDGSLAIVDYESTNDEEDLLKYGYYMIGVIKRYLANGERPDIRVFVLYTADIEKCNPFLHKTGIDIRIEPAYLLAVHSEEWMESVTEHISRQKITDETLMRLILLPLTYKGTEAKQIVIRKCVELAEQIKDRNQETFALAGLLTFTDKVINAETRTYIEEAISLTQVGRMLMDRGRMEGLTEGTKKANREFALEMLRAHEPKEKILRYTKLTEEELKALEEEACAMI